MIVTIEKDSTMLFSYETSVIPRIGEHIEHHNEHGSERYKVTSLIHVMAKHNDGIKQYNATVYVENIP